MILLLSSCAALASHWQLDITGSGSMQALADPYMFFPDHPVTAYSGTWTPPALGVSSFTYNGGNTYIGMTTAYPDHVKLTS